MNDNKQKWMLGGIFVTVLLVQGCALTKVVTVPARAVGTVVGAVPVVGDVTEAVIDTGAAAIDLVPL